MEIILPIAKRRNGKRSDLLRLKILTASMQRFWHGGALTLITPDVEEVSAELERLRFDANVLHDDSVFAGLPTRLHPWWRQQLLKLAASRIVQSEFYLVLDADCFFVRDTRPEDLVINGRGRVSYGEGPAFSHKNWYNGCRKLGLEAPAQAVNVTPFVFHRGLAQEAFEFVQHRPESIGKLGWSEYTLYHSLATQQGCWDEHHVAGEPFLGNEVWMPEELETWDASRGFAQGSYRLSLVQSNTGATAERVWAQVKDFFH